MIQDRKNLLIAICFILYGVIMSGLWLFLKRMGLDYIFGFGSGFLLAIGCFALISRDFRNLS